MNIQPKRPIVHYSENYTHESKDTGSKPEKAIGTFVLAKGEKIATFAAHIMSQSTKSFETFS